VNRLPKSGYESQADAPAFHRDERRRSNSSKERPQLGAFLNPEVVLVHQRIRVRFAPDAVSVPVESVGVTTLNSGVLRDFGVGAVKVAATGGNADVGIGRMAVRITRRAARRSGERLSEIVPPRGDAYIPEESERRDY
jgi:hypothetical protein